MDNNYIAQNNNDSDTYKVRTKSGKIITVKNKHKNPAIKEAAPDMHKKKKALKANLKLNLKSPDTIYNGIIMSEILGPPRAYRKRIR